MVEGSRGGSRAASGADGRTCPPRGTGSPSSRAAYGRPAGLQLPDEIGSVGRNGTDAAVTPRRPRLHLLTLRLSPAGLERRFWEEHGRPSYSRTDRSALIFMAFNLIVGMEQYKRLGKPEYPWLSYAMMLVQVGLALVDIAARVWITLRPESYARARDTVAFINRSISFHTLVGFFSLKQPGWRIFTRHGPDMTPEAASGVLLRTLFLLGLFWVMHTMLFPFALRRAAPMQAVVCMIACFAVCHFACLVRQDAVLFAGAQLLCSQVERLKGGIFLALGLGSSLGEYGGTAAGAAPPLCAVASMELLVPWFMAMACFIPITVLYERERTLKLRFLRSAGHPQPDDLAGDIPAALRYTVFAATMLMASSAIADAAARWGRPYTC